MLFGIHYCMTIILAMGTLIAMNDFSVPAIWGYLCSSPPQRKTKNKCILFSGFVAISHIMFIGGLLCNHDCHYLVAAHNSYVQDRGTFKKYLLQSKNIKFYQNTSAKVEDQWPPPNCFSLPTNLLVLYYKDCIINVSIKMYIETHKLSICLFEILCRFYSI